jgi:hypothetical protein
MGWSEAQGLTFSGELATFHSTLLRWLSEDVGDDAPVDERTHAAGLAAAGRLLARGLDELLAGDHPSDRRRARKKFDARVRRDPTTVGEALEALDVCADLFSAAALAGSLDIRERIRLETLCLLYPNDADVITTAIGRSSLDVAAHVVVERTAEAELVVTAIRPQYGQPLDSIRVASR